MDSKTFFREAIATASRVMDEVKAEDLASLTPDTECTVGDLIAHMMYELAWTSEIVNGKTISEVGATYDQDLIDDDLQGSWHRYRERALLAIEKADEGSIAHLSYGDVPMHEYLRQAGSDQAIHAWDLAEGLNRELVYPDELTSALLDYAEANKEMLRSSGLFGSAIDVAEDAPAQTKLLALYGRSDTWRKDR